MKYKVTFYDMSGKVVGNKTIEPDVNLMMRGESAIIRKAAKDADIRYYFNAKVEKQ